MAFYKKSKFDTFIRFTDAFPTFFLPHNPIFFRFAFLKAIFKTKTAKKKEKNKNEQLQRI